MDTTEVERMMTDNILFLPLIITLIFWAYRECSYLITTAYWRPERAWFQQSLLRGATPETTGASQVIFPPGGVSPQPDEELTPEQLKEREEELAARLQRDRLEQLKQEKLDTLTSESESAFAEFTGDRGAAV